jgi:hypothetical protein
MDLATDENNEAAELHRSKQRWTSLTSKSALMLLPFYENGLHSKMGALAPPMVDAHVQYLKTPWTIASRNSWQTLQVSVTGVLSAEQNRWTGPAAGFSVSGGLFGQERTFGKLHPLWNFYFQPALFFIQNWWRKPKMILKYLGVGMIAVAALSFASTADARSHHKRHHHSSMNSMEPKAGANSSPKQVGTTTPPQPTSKASTSETPKR